MASVKEVNSFIFKFNQLWKSGFSADLNFKCYAGQAFATLQVGLGYADNLATPNGYGSHDVKPSKHVSPSQLRRRVRRENLRKVDDSNLAEKADDLNFAEKADDLNLAEKADDVVKSDSNDVDLVDLNDEDINDINDDKILQSSNDIDGNSCATTDDSKVDDGEAAVGNAVAKEGGECAVQVKDNFNDTTADLPIKNISSEKDVEELNIKVDGQSQADKALPDLVEVYATATYSQCPYSQLSQDDLDSLYRFTTSKDHLKNNIASINYDRIYSHGADNAGTFEHSIQFRISVKRQNLWEGARSYIWKHLGTDVWERGNGTKIKLSRIHQK